jgi:hypothetical protein
VVGTKLGTAELSVIDGYRGDDMPKGLLAFLIFVFFLALSFRQGVPALS